MLRTMQPETQHEWAKVGEAIVVRRKELYATKSAFFEASVAADPKDEGISSPTLKRYEKGGAIGRSDKQWVLCDTLHWTRDSIDRILSGRPPLTVESDPAGHGGSLGWPIEWENEVVKVRDDLGELRDEVAGLGRALEALTDALSERKDGEET